MGSGESGAINVFIYVYANVDYNYVSIVLNYVEAVEVVHVLV